MKRIFLLVLTALVLAAVPMYGQKSGTADTYNLQKAYEVLNEDGDDAKALELLDKQFQETPENVEALLLRARIRRGREEYGAALSDINQAIKVWNRKAEIVMSTLCWWQATVYMDILEYGKAEASFKTAIAFSRKDNKEHTRDMMFDYGQCLYEQDKYDESDGIYRQILHDDESDLPAMIGLARNMVDREQYQEAIDMLGKVKRLDVKYSEVYRFEMKAYDGMGEYEKAVEAGLGYVELDDDAADFNQVIDIMDKCYPFAVAKIKAKLKNNDDRIMWQALLTRLYELNYDYELAIKEYDKLEENYGKDPAINYSRSNCYDELGLTEIAIKDITAGMDDADYYDYCLRGTYYRHLGRYEEAIADYTMAIEDAPDRAFGYYARGWCYELNGDDGKAMDDYNLGISIDRNYPYIYLMRGEIYLKRGETEKAMADFEQIVLKDTVAADGSCRHYALHFLGKDEEALEWMNKIIEAEPKEYGHFYDLACLYSRMDNTEEALKAMERAFEMGYARFAHIEHDDDMDPIREMPEFKDLCEKYRQKHRERIENSGLMSVEELAEDVVTELDIKRHSGGTFEVPCEINGLPLQMIFDTGASDVTISSVEANFMLKNGYLGEKDIKGKRYYQVANGNLAEGTVITLKEVRIGDAVLKNVDASVVKSQKAPLLFGQSAMERFGTITIDNINNKLLIKYKR